MAEEEKTNTQGKEAKEAKETKEAKKAGTPDENPAAGEAEEVKEAKEAKESASEAEAASETDEAEEAEEADGCRPKKRDKKKRELEAKVKEAEAKAAAAEDKYLRLAAEYDNFRKRSQKEREGIYGDAYADALSKLLPVLDNLERASQYQDSEKLADGVKLILKGVPDVLTSLGVEQFGEAGDVFDPKMHSAVAMVDESEQEPGHIVAVWQKGYKRGEKVLRYAAVTVAGDGT